MKHTEANVFYALLLIERGMSKVNSLCVFGPYTSKYVSSVIILSRAQQEEVIITFSPF